MMAKVLGALSLTVFMLSAIVHVLTFVPGFPVSMHLVWPLHPAAAKDYLAKDNEFPVG
jgi:hypothetical protein